MTIGIIGSGAIGTAFARTLARAGIEATISNSRGPDSLNELVQELGPSIKAGTREEAARADIVFVAVNWTKLPAALAGPAGVVRPHSHRRQQSDRGAAVQAGRSQGPGIERGRRRSCAGRARRQGVQSSPRGSARRRSAVGRRPARAVLFRQRQRREGGGGGAHRPHRLRRHRSRDRWRSAASLRNSPAGRCRTKTSSRSPDRSIHDGVVARGVRIASIATRR